MFFGKPYQNSFAFYGYSANFENLCSICLRDFNEILQGYSLVNCQISSTRVDGSKNMGTSGWGISVVTLVSDTGSSWISFYATACRSQLWGI